MDDTLKALLTEFQADWFFTQQFFFKHRHKESSPPFHKTILDAWLSETPRLNIKCFRGAGKTTLAEEAAIIAVLFQLTDFVIIIGNTYTAACDRLAAIRHELTTNPKIQAVFGSLEGQSWTQDKLLLSNNGLIQALGAGQSVRGAKNPVTSSRPGLALVDDFEDRDSVLTPEGRRRNEQWFSRELEPALAPDARVRVNGTPLHVESVIEKFSRSPNWETLEFPIYTMDGDAKVPAWPERFPVTWIDFTFEKFQSDGDLAGFSQEYLLRPIADVASIFDRSSVQVVAPTAAPGLIGFAPRILIVDPARTTNSKTSARTGYAVGSWVGNALYVHEAFGGFHTPSEQIDTIFTLAEAFQPMTVAVEEDGLNQWLMEPIRAEMTRRGIILPLQAVKAPRNKDAFIRGLQPFFHAKEVWFMKELPDLVAEMLSFPLGRKDVVNAVAYLLRLRGGMPVYGSFTPENVRHRPSPHRADHALFVNATEGMLFATLVFIAEGTTHVIKDWVLEGNLDDSLRSVLVSVNMALPTPSGSPSIYVPYDRTLVGDMAGLPATCKRLGVQMRPGKRFVEAEGCLEDAMRSRKGVTPLLTVSPDATWTVNALAGGYARESGTVSLMIRDNIHKHVAQTLESGYSAATGVLFADPAITDVVWGTTQTGRKYISMRR